MSDDIVEAQHALNAARARRRRQALGPPLGQSDADLDLIAQAGPQDAAAVEAFIRDSAGEIGVAMFRAKRDG